MSRGGANSCPKRGAGFFVARAVFNSPEPKGESFYFSQVIHNLPASPGGYQGIALQLCLTRRFWRHEFTPPLNNGRGFILPHLIFHAFLNE